MFGLDRDEFGEVDDEEMILAATRADQDRNTLRSYHASPVPHQPRKRRRLNGPEDQIEEGSFGSHTESRDARSHSREFGNKPEVVQVENDETDVDSEYEVSSMAGQKVPGGEGIGTPNNKTRSKHLIHIPKRTELPPDTFCTQLPNSSQSPYRMRGAYWLKPKPLSPSLGSRVSRVQQPTVKSLQPHVSRPLSHPLGAYLINHTTTHRQDQSLELVEELADLPSDAFSSSSPIGNKTKETVELSPDRDSCQEWQSQALRPQRLVGTQSNLRQTTLFGGRATEGGSPTQTQSVRRHNWPLANRNEAKTHHKLNQEALRTWVYPTNLGNIRDYQFSIVGRGLYHNLLVALPTGLGKTFIAATIMLNWFRWTEDAQIVFVAPTKPLVSQQVDACFNIAGIPRSETTLLTGSTPPGIRAEEWKTKRVFFMTPQTIVNDLKHGTCDPKRIVLLVVDEAHRATGAYAYVEVVKFLRRFNTSFRVLALTATPGASVESVQEVIDGLGISRVEIRTEESIDISKYVHPRKIDTVLFEYSDDMILVMDLFAKALQPVLNKLTSMNAYWSRDPMTLTPYGCTQARQRWNASDAGQKAHGALKGMVNGIFTILASLAHSIELLKYHGIGPFFHKVVEFRQEASGSKYKRQINDDEHFKDMMMKVQGWVNHSEFVGHPKLEYLRSVVLNHFLDAGEGRGAAVGVSPASTRVMVFAHYRDSAEEIARVLKRNEPMIRPHVFVGQANSKGSDGMGQKTQLEIIRKFKDGIYNTIVATSIGEEGLDIGEVDLIVCYDASASPIRMLQRMGRTGRKRAGNIVVTLMKGKEENSFAQAKDNYEKMQRMIAAGTRFTFHEDLAPRIVPKDIQPVPDKRMIDIPLENTQSDLPEPKKRARAPKRPPKKFHMPDGVRTGFTSASRLDNDDDDDDSDANSLSKTPVPQRLRTPTPEPVPALETVLLTLAEERDLERRYLDVGGDTPQIVEVPRLDAFPSRQRRLGTTKFVRHGHVTKRVVRVLHTMHCTDEASVQGFETNLTEEDRRSGEHQAQKRAAFLRGVAGGVTALDKDTYDVPESGSESDALSGSAVNSRAKAPARAKLISSDNGDDNEAWTADSIANEDEGIGNTAPSSASSLPPEKSPEKEKLFYELSRKGRDNDADSNDELPELDDLVGKQDLMNDSVRIQQPATNELPRPMQRKGRRKVLESDSDE